MHDLNPNPKTDPKTGIYRMNQK